MASPVEPALAPTDEVKAAAVAQTGLGARVRSPATPTVTKPARAPPTRTLTLTQAMGTSGMDPAVSHSQFLGMGSPRCR